MINIDNVKELNLLADNAYHFEILSMPKLSLFAQTFELPGCNMGIALQPSPMVDIPHPGDKVDFNDLQITFLVDEKLEAYKEVWKWMMYLAAPKSTEEYKKLVESESPYTRVSDIRMNVLTNKSNITQPVVFVGCFPYALSGILFNAANTEVEHPIATASFTYAYYYFKGDDTLATW